MPKWPRSSGPVRNEFRFWSGTASSFLDRAVFQGTGVLKRVQQKWNPVLRPDTRQKNTKEQDDDSKIRHLALSAPRGRTKSFHGPNIGYEGLDLSGVLHAGRGFDARRHVHTLGFRGMDCFHHVQGVEPSSQQPGLFGLDRAEQAPVETQSVAAWPG